jgi:hypothetical protein
MRRARSAGRLGGGCFAGKVEGRTVVLAIIEARQRTGLQGPAEDADLLRMAAVASLDWEGVLMSLELLLLPGDGIGPEITAATRRVLEAADRRYGLGLTFETEGIGFESLAREGTTLPGRVLERARTMDGVVLGPVSTAEYPPRDQGGINPSAALRIGLDLYANIRPSRTFPGVPAAVWAMTS